MKRQTYSDKIARSRRQLWEGRKLPVAQGDEAAEGGCGVIGLACELPVAGRHLVGPLEQMRNRGNGKGGGVAMVGLDPDQLGVDRRTLEESYLLAVAYLDPAVRQEVEQQHVETTYEVDHVWHRRPTTALATGRVLEVDPPEVVVYFVRPRAAAVEAFLRDRGLQAGDFPSRRELEDEVVYQSSFRLNLELYAGERGNLAFVLSHGKNLLVLKMVGYAEDVIRSYRLEEMTAHVWIGHHRYPTKGRVWHPGGAHPFVGLNEALVHNGDFANYHSMVEYLEQRHIRPLFLTDTEAAALVFDLHSRTYGYPLEYVIESLAPTTERDFTLLPADKRQVYRLLQTTHMHGSPDGPWFFIIAQNQGDCWRLIGITDTSMLRPQVFALQRGETAIALCGSEKQVIDAVLENLAREDPRFWRRADRYWAARGGSHTDGGAFLFTLARGDDGSRRLQVTDKFGAVVGEDLCGDPGRLAAVPVEPDLQLGTDWEPETAFPAVAAALATWGWSEAQGLLGRLASLAAEPAQRRRVIGLLTLLLDRRYPCGRLRRSRWLTELDACLEKVVAAVEENPGGGYRLHPGPEAGLAPVAGDQAVILDARRYAVEGEGSLSREMVALHAAGWRCLVVVRATGHRFIGCGFGPQLATAGSDPAMRIDVYGAPGDYLASGSDGLEVHVHGSGQDQLAQIFKRGTLVVHGDVGQAFCYGAKGGKIFVLGSAAGRPLINAVGSPRVVINGTCLDYLAESFMAGDPLKGGGFVVVNGVEFDAEGRLRELPSPYPGSNLFSLASGGALYVRDPRRQLDEEQLNGGVYAELTDADWELVLPYLEENAEHFGIPVERLLTVDGRRLAASEVYRKIRPSGHRALQAEEAWVVGRRGKRA